MIDLTGRLVPANAMNAGLINRQHIYARFNCPVGRGVSTRGVHILIRPGVAVLSRQFRAFSVANLNAHAYLNTETAANSDASHSLIADSNQLAKCHRYKQQAFKLKTAAAWKTYHDCMHGCL